MANLTYRAERALLGALLRDPDALDDIRFLTAGDFASDQHREVFSAIAAAHAQAPDDSHAPFEFAVAFSAPPPGISVRYLQALSETCPDPANVRAYARMVMESSSPPPASRPCRPALPRRRRPALRGRQIQQSRPARQWCAGVCRPPDEARPRHVDERQDIRPGRGDPGRPSAGGRPRRDRRSGRVGRRHPVTATAAAADEQARQEEDVLADLIQHHWQNSNVLDWLPADAFTAGPRRDVYEAIAALGRSRPANRRAHRRMAPGQHDRAASPAIPEPAPAGARAMTRSLAELIGYVGLLAALPVADGVATMTGRALLDRHAKAAGKLSRSRARPQQSAPAHQPLRRHPTSARQAPAAQSGGTPATAPPQSFGASPSRPPDLLGPPPAGPRQPGPLPRP